MAEAHPAGTARHRSWPRLVAVVGVVLLLGGVVVWSLTRTEPARPPDAGGTTTSSAPVRPDSMVTLGLEGWTVQSSALAPAAPEAISQPGFATDGWLPVKPDDAGAPGTEVGALVQNGRCPDLYVSDHLAQCRNGVGGAAGGDPAIPPFDVPWWFRTEFSPDLTAGDHAELVINGVVGAADVWVNGTKVADRSRVQGSFARVDLDVTTLLHPGVNALAIEVATNDPATMLTVSTVDWTQPSPDAQTGIQFPVQLHRSGAVSLADAHVTQDDAPDLSRAALTVHGQVTNHATVPRTATVAARISPPGDGPPIDLRQDLTLAAGEIRAFAFTPAGFPELAVTDPAVWWPSPMGAQPLYAVSTTVTVDGVPSDGFDSTFGIRTVSSSLTPPTELAPQGSRRFVVNGVPVVIRGAGWSEDLLLRYSNADAATQVALVKSLGINTVRTEGHEMPDDFYQRMDRAGILISAGYQCCAGGWDRSPGDPALTEVQRDSLARTALNIGQRLRNHPSVFTYGWSDLAPSAEQESISLAGFTAADFSVPIIASAEYRSTPTLGPSGEREGPYLWVPPAYWYDNVHPGDPGLADLDPLGDIGGAWGFVSESSAGHTVPTLDSIRRFLSPAEQDALWRSPATPQFHTTFDPPDDPSRLASLVDLDAAITARYGPWSSLEQYVQQAQVQNYEDTRAQFEAFVAHAATEPNPSTGTIYWQLNKGWPTLLWALYNQDYDLPGSYFGAQTANRPVHVIYAEDTGSVTLANLTGAALDGLRVEAKVYDLAGNVIDDQVADALTLSSQQVRSGVLTPRLPVAAPGEPARTSFIELTLTRDGQRVDRNVYWHSTRPDQVDWSQTPGAVAAVMTRYADLRDLQALAPAQVRVVPTTADADDGSGDRVTTVTVTNTSTTPTVAFFLRLDLRRGRDGQRVAGDDQVAPVVWSGNDVTLWPGESETLTVRYRPEALQGDQPVVSVSGWNVPPATVAG